MKRSKQTTRTNMWTVNIQHQAFKISLNIVERTRKEGILEAISIRPWSPPILFLNNLNMYVFDIPYASLCWLTAWPQLHFRSNQIGQVINVLGGRPHKAAHGHNLSDMLALGKLPSRFEDNFLGGHVSGEQRFSRTTIDYRTSWPALPGGQQWTT